MRALPLLVAASILSPVALAKTNPATGSAGGCPFADRAQVAVAGIARSVKSGAEEPGESINTYFFLETSGPPCGKQKISVFAAGVIPCTDGDKATVRGLYYRPSKAPFDYPMIDLATVTCRTDE